jgi:hypothetical protein
MIHDYMKILEKDRRTLDDNYSMIEETLEQLSYRRIKSLYNHLDNLSRRKKFIGKGKTIVSLSSFS